MMTVMGSISHLEETEFSLTSLLMCLMAYRSWELINCHWTSRHLLILIQRTLVLPFRPGKTMPILYVFKENVLTLFVWIWMLYMVLLCPLCIVSYCEHLHLHLHGQFPNWKVAKVLPNIFSEIFCMMTAYPALCPCGQEPWFWVSTQAKVNILDW